MICLNNDFNWRGQILNLIHWERLKLVPDLLLNFQLTLDRLILFFMQICLLKVVTFIDLSAPCSQLTAWKFQRTEQNILGPDITETIVTAPLNKPTFVLSVFWQFFLTIISFFFSVLGATLQFTCGTPDGQLFLHHKYHPLHGCGTLCPLSGLAYHNWDPCGSPSSTGWHCSHYLHCHGNFLIKH